MEQMEQREQRERSGPYLTGATRAVRLGTEVAAVPPAEQAPVDFLVELLKKLLAVFM